MAKKKKNWNKATAREREEALRFHIWCLGLSTREEYFSWCIDCGFDASANKSPMNLRHELEYHERQSADQALKKARKRKNLLYEIERFCLGDTCLKDISNNHNAAKHSFDACQYIRKHFKGKHARLELLGFLQWIDKNSSLIDASELANGFRRPYIFGLLALATYRAQWLRDLTTWKARSYNCGRQLSSLIRHLLAHYSVPAFLDSVWLRRDKNAAKYQLWYVQIAQGDNPRRGNAPVPMTKRMAHLFLQAPANCSVEQAIRRAQVHSLGGDDRLCQAVFATHIANNLEHNEFWLSVIAFFIRHPMLDRVHFHPVVDFLYAHKFRVERVYDANNRIRDLPPPQPHLSMKGRTPDTLLAHVNRWHDALGRGSVKTKMVWQAKRIEGFTMITGKDLREITWRIRELLSHKELVREGRALSHCVASYAHSCVNGRCSIWSMTSEDAAGNVRHCVTIEILTAQNRIAQVRGRANRLPRNQEARVIEQWAKEQNLIFVKERF